MKSQSQDFLKNCKATQIEPFKEFLFFLAELNYNL